MPTPSLRSNIPTSEGTGSNNMVVTKPSDAVQGDTIVVWITTNSISNPITAPDGSWSSLEQLDGPGGASGRTAIEAFTKIVGASEPSTWTFVQTLATTPWVAVAVALYGGTVTLYNAATNDDTAGSTLTSASITTTAADDRVLSAFMQDQTASDGDFAVSSPGTLTALAEEWAGSNQGLFVCSEIRAAAGAGAHEVTQTTGGDSARGGLSIIVAAHATGDGGTWGSHRRVGVAGVA